MLPLPWINRIFERLTLRYGNEFLNRWKGQPIADVKTDWCYVLAGYANDARAIAYALDNLPDDRPPTAQQFRSICRSAPSILGSQRLEYKVDPDIAKRAIDALQSMIAPVKAIGRPSYEWAYAIKARDEVSPNTITPTVRAMYKAVVARNPI
jgi:hypothetical protein